MKKQLRFIYRYLTTSRRWRRWFNRQNLLIVLISAAFLSVLSWTAPLSTVEGQNVERAQLPGALELAAVTDAAAVADAAQQETPAPEQERTVTSTPLPPEFLANADQTIGITVAGALLVLIVIIGVLKFQPGIRPE